MEPIDTYPEVIDVECPLTSQFWIYSSILTIRPLLNASFFLGGGGMGGQTWVAYHLQGEIRLLMICPNGKQKCPMVHVQCKLCLVFPFTTYSTLPLPNFPIYKKDRFNLIICPKMVVKNYKWSAHFALRYFGWKFWTSMLEQAKSILPFTFWQNFLKFLVKWYLQPIVSYLS